MEFRVILKDGEELSKSKDLDAVLPLFVECQELYNSAMDFPQPMLDIVDNYNIVGSYQGYTTDIKEIKLCVERMV